MAFFNIQMITFTGIALCIVKMYQQKQKYFSFNLQNFSEKH